VTWWQRLWRRSEAEAQLDKELLFHLDQHAADLSARGIHPDEARRRARLALGGLDQVKEACRDVRGTRWLEDLLIDIRYAIRTFRQLPGFAGIAVLILGLGIGATTVMFTVIDGVLLEPLSYPEPDRLVTPYGFTDSFGESWGFSYPDFVDAKAETRVLRMAAWKYGGGTISAPGEPEYVNGREISAGLFDVLGIGPAEGRSFLAKEDRAGEAPVAIISDSLWRRRYASTPAIVGQRLVFDGKPYTIVGVAPPGLTLDGEADVFTPLGQDTEPRMRNREARFLRVVARVERGVALSDAQAELAVIGRHLADAFPKANARRELRARPLQQDVVGDIAPTLWLLLAAVTLVLLIACVNIASLLLARAVARQRELATRVALGASRRRVIRQCLAESAVLGIAGGALGVLLAAVSIRPFVSLWPGSLPRAGEIQLDWRVLFAALAVSLTSGLAFGLAPALRVPMAGIDEILRAGGRTITASSRRLHGAFVVTEVAMAIVLLVSAGMLARTLVSLSSLDPGLDVRSVLTARFALSPGVQDNPEHIEAAWQDVLQRARGVPGVAFAALTDIIPMRPGENSLPYSTTATPPAPNEAPFSLASAVTPDYLKVMGIRLRHGRFFDDFDRLGGDPVVVIDENLALHAFGRTDVVGRQLWVRAMGPRPIRIVGVVAHVRHWGLATDDRSRVRDQMYYPFAQVPPQLLRTFSSFMSLAVRTQAAPSDVIEPLRRALRGAASDQALYQIRTMEQLVSASLDRQRFLALLFAIFGGLALLLASVGLYGVLADLTSQRAPEIGVRMALGATGGDVVRLVLRQSAVLVGFGIVTGTCGAWAVARLLERFVEGSRPADPMTFVIMTGILVMAAMLASLVPARRAAQVDTTHTLRHD
jgi:predicted permease